VTSPRPRRIGAAALIVVIGLLNFHVPHFLLESGNPTGTVGARLLEAALLITMAAAVGAAIGIYRDRPWGWYLGGLVVLVGVAMYVAQETIGLPGLPRVWWEPSRILALALEALYLHLAMKNCAKWRRRYSRRAI